MANKMNAMSSGLASLINSYLSEDESDDNEEEKLNSNQNMERLPLPLAILNRNVLVEQPPTDDPMLHDGRVRSFPHQRGNWASLIYVPYNASGIYNNFCKKIIAVASHAVNLTMVEEPHISLTRTFVLFHHWIESFVKSVEEQLKCSDSFYLDFGELSVFLNEEKNRTFVGLAVSTGFSNLKSSVEKIDTCLKDFKLPTFYDNPSFHMSLAWCLGDEKKTIERLLPDLDVCFREFLAEHPELFTINITHHVGKIGNKTFIFHLKDS